MIRPWLSPHAVVVRSFLETFSPQDGSDWLCVYDAAASPWLFEAFRADGARSVCLFSPRAAQRLAEVAPWIAPIPRSGDALRVLGHVWGDGAAFLVRTTLTAEGLRDHLRPHIRPPGDPLTLLRLYDPRVLRAILRSSTADEVQPLFAGIEELCLEGEQPQTAEWYAMSEGQLACRETPAHWIRPRECPERLIFLE